MAAPDAIVVGAGPNGLAAAIALAQAGLRVVVYEAEPTIGGGCRSEPLTLPGFVHDVCSSVYPMAVASPFFQSLPLGDHGLKWIHAPARLREHDRRGETVRTGADNDRVWSCHYPEELSDIRITMAAGSRSSTVLAAFPA